MKNILIILFVTILVASCKKDTETNPSPKDYLIFGHFYGFCFGEQCVELYKVDDTQVAEDTLDDYPRRDTFYNGKFIPLSNSKFVEVKDVISAFPTDLLNEKDTVLGMPDAGDWGGFYVEYNFKGTRRFWIIDKLKPNVPSKYHDFMKKMEDKIVILQK